VYHFTDLPSFVSGEYLVYFDPHTSFLPGATVQHPGLRIKFTRNNILDQSCPAQSHRDMLVLRECELSVLFSCFLHCNRRWCRFPDQFRPYLLLGCDLKQEYLGTLFRFPLRTNNVLPPDPMMRTSERRIRPGIA
jgi:sacsin